MDVRKHFGSNKRFPGVLGRYTGASLSLCKTHKNLTLSVFSHESVRFVLFVHRHSGRLLCATVLFFQRERSGGKLVSRHCGIGARARTPSCNLRPRLIIFTSDVLVNRRSCRVSKITCVFRLHGRKHANRIDNIIFVSQTLHTTIRPSNRTKTN